MSGLISGNMVGSYSQIGKTFILTDENGTELTGVVVDKMTIFDATDNDVRDGKVYASDSGVSTGTKDIPAYYTTEGVVAVPVGSSFVIKNLPDYEYTKLQVIICAFNTSMSNSVAAEKISINSKVYAVGSVNELATVVVDIENKAIDLGIINDGETPCVIRYLTYKEEL